MTVYARRLIVARVLAGHWPGEVAKQLEISRQTVYKWVRRWRAEGQAGLVDRCAGGSRRLGGRQPQHRLHRLTTSQGRRMVQPWWPDCVVQARSTGFVGDRMHI